MTNPGGSSGLTPGQWGISGTDGSIPAKSQHTQGNITQNLQNSFSSEQFGGLGGGLIAMILSFIGAAVGGILSGFANIADAIFGIADNDYIAAMPIINNHTNTLADLTEAVEQLILQGLALRYDDNDEYTPNENVVSVDVIVIGAGGGGGSGSYDFFTSGTRSGGGGGGGGETHVSVPASLLPKNLDGTYKAIQIFVGAGGDGAPGDSGSGTGGGHSTFGPEVGSGDPSWLLGGGGQGGTWGNTPPTAAGGIGMVAGGNGDAGIGPGGAGVGAGHSSSPYDLHGGGGGGGRGFCQSRGGASPGGGGGIAPGGEPGQPGSPPSSIVATGGGGGGGGDSDNDGGANGSSPAGGGGGSACNTSGALHGGNGGDGVIFIIERMA